MSTPSVPGAAGQGSARVPGIGYLGWGDGNAAVQRLLSGQSGQGESNLPPRIFLPEARELPAGLVAMSSVEALLQEQTLVFVDLSPTAWRHLLPVVRLAISDRNVLVLVATGLNLRESLEQLHERKLIRCLVLPFDQPRQATVIYCPTVFVGQSDLAHFRSGFAQVRQLLEVAEEERFEVARALVGVAPAVFHTLTDALADGALMAGLPRGEALPLLSSVLAEAARQSVESGAPPAELRELALQAEGAAAGVMELESAGLRGLLMRVVMRAVGNARPQHEEASTAATLNYSKD